MRSIFTIFLMIVWVQAHAQGQPSLQDVKLSGRYHWGEGFSTDRQQAIDLARQDLVQKMVVTITAEQNLTVTDDGSGPESNFELRSKSLSRMQLRGLDYLVTQRRDQSFQATAFVSKAEFDRSMADLKARVLTQLSQMNAAEARGHVSAAIREAFDILVQTYFIPVPVIVDSVEVQSHVRGRLSAWLDGTSVTVPSVGNLSAPGRTELNLEAVVRIGTVPVEDLLLQLNRPGYGEHPVRGGRADVFLDVEPQSPVQDIELKLMAVIPASMDAEMKALAQEIRPVRTLKVPVDFSKAISIDMSVTKLLGDGYRFTEKFTNLSVFDLSWDFGQGLTSNQTSPRVELPGIPAAGRTVTLVVNRSPELTIRRNLMPDGTLRMPGSAPAPARASVRPALPETAPVKTPVPAPTTNTAMVIDQIAMAQRNHLDPLLRHRNAAAFTDQLEGLKQRNLLRYGRSTDVGPIEHSYVAIVDPADRSVRAVLSPVIDGVRYDLATNETVAPDEMRERFRGLGTIWFSFH